MEKKGKFQNRGEITEPIYESLFDIEFDTGGSEISKHLSKGVTSFHIDESNKQIWLEFDMINKELYRFFRKYTNIEAINKITITLFDKTFGVYSKVELEGLSRFKEYEIKISGTITIQTYRSYALGINFMKIEENLF